MLYIVRKCDVEVANVRRREGCSRWRLRECEPYDYTWHVGLQRPCAVGDTPFGDVCEIQADCHELDYIRSRFKNLPDSPDSRVVRWKGEMAQFIYDHLI